MTGDHARLVAEALQSEREYSEMMGLPIEIVDDPVCLNTKTFLPLILFGSIVIFLLYNIRYGDCHL